MEETTTPLPECRNIHKERRWAPRNHTCIEANIYSDTDDAVPCIISIISMNGMYLYTNTACANLFQHESQLTIEFTFEYDCVVKHFYEKVAIVHTSEFGIAVTFKQFNSSHCSILQQLFHYIYHDQENNDLGNSAGSGFEMDLHRLAI